MCAEHGCLLQLILSINVEINETHFVIYILWWTSFDRLSRGRIFLWGEDNDAVAAPQIYADWRAFHPSHVQMFLRTAGSIPLDWQSEKLITSNFPVNDCGKWCSRFASEYCHLPSQALGPERKPKSCKSGSKLRKSIKKTLLSARALRTISRALWNPGSGTLLMVCGTSDAENF